MKPLVLFLLFLSFAFACKAQEDIITVMHYNLMCYGVNTPYCDSNTYTNIGLNTRDNCLKTILKYYMPDIFTVNEMDKKSMVQQHLLANCLNTDGVSYYKMAKGTNCSHSPNIINQLFFNADKFELVKQDSIYTISANRDIDVYKLFYKAHNLSATHDTAFIYCFVMHLPQTSPEQATVTSKLMNYITSNNLTGNKMAMGDFNLVSSSDPGYQNMTSVAVDPDIRFYDPINQPGSWHADTSFAKYHTQSTHVSGDGSGFTPGGLDDRFDFILVSNSLQNNSAHFEYVNGSYHALGEDGKHFKKGVKDPPANNSAPDEIINAVSCMSDHLPMTLQLKIDQSYTVPSDLNIDIIYQNPVVDELAITIKTKNKTSVTLEIYNVLGQKIISNEITEAGTSTTYNLSTLGLRTGIYFIKATDNENNNVTKKFFKP